MGRTETFARLIVVETAIGYCCVSIRAHTQLPNGRYIWL